MAPGNRTVITDRQMQARQTGVDTWMHEAFERGAGVFAARITPAGERLFYFRYTDSTGKRPYLKLGAYKHAGSTGGLTVAAARELARQRSALYRSGVRDLHAHFDTVHDANNLAAEAGRQNAAAELQRLQTKAEQAALDRQSRISLRTLFERWAKTELRPHARADGTRTGRRDGGAYTLAQFERRLFPLLGDVAVADISKAQLLGILDSVKAEGKLRTATVLLTDLKQMFRFALTRDLVQRNPLDIVSKRDVGGAAVERDRALSPEELRLLSAAVRKSEMPSRTEPALWLVLATAVRLGELLGATWTERAGDKPALASTADACGVKLGFVDLVAGTWYLPSTKNQRDHTIHLSKFATTQFQTLARQRDTSPRAEDRTTPWVFPNFRGDAPLRGPHFGKLLSDRQRTPERRLKGRTLATQDLMLPGGRWTAHDLRRTAATLMAEIGVSGDVIDECLNHIIESRVRRIYVRDRRSADQAKAFDALGTRLETLLVPTDRPERRATRKAGHGAKSGEGLARPRAAAHP